MPTNTPFSLIISDLHLSDSRDDASRCFLDFMTHTAPHAEKLFIIGDFFEFWLGDDDVSAFNQQIINALKSLNAKGVKLYFIHGNRDFLIGKKFAGETGMTLLKDPTVLTLYNHKLLLSHGDIYCTDDLDYQRLRRLCHNPYLQWCFLHLPLFIRLKIALYMRKKSAATRKPVEITDVNHDAIVNAFHPLNVNNSDCFRYVLGDWHDTGSALKIDKSGIQFVEVTVNSNA